MQEASIIGFQDVRRAVIARIQSQVWPVGTLLPTDTALAQEFGVGRATVNRALRDLADEGLVDRRRKRGTTVAATPVRQARIGIENIRQTIQDRNAAYRYALVTQDRGPAPDWLRARTGLGPEVLHLTCMHYADGQPFQFEERWIGIAAVPGVLDADFARIGPNEWLLAEMPVSTAEIAFSAVAADASLADHLNAAPGAPLFRMERATWFRDAPVTFVRMTFHPGHAMTTRL